MFVRPARWAAYGVVGALGSAFLAWLFTTPNTEGLKQRFTPEHVDFILMIDSAPQRRAQLAAFLTTALAAGLAWWWRGRASLQAQKPSSSWRSRGRWVLGPVVAVALVAIVGGPPGALVGSGLVAALVAASGFVPRTAALVVVAVLTSYAALLLLPGIFVTPDLATAPPFPLLLIEWHYAYVVSAGDRLASGLELFTQVMPPYGVLVPTLLGAWERARGLLSWGAHIQLMHVMNLALALAALAAGRLWFRRLPGVAVMLLALLPWVSSFHPSTLLPNQSAFRFLGLVCAVLALVWLSRKPRALWAPGLGLVTGALAVFNPETAVASLAGFVVFAFLTKVSMRELLLGAVRFVAAALVPLLMWILVFRLTLGAWPFPSSASALVDLALRFSGGYGGFGWQKVWIAVVVLAHAVFCVVVAFARRGVTRRGAIRAAIGATIVVWFAYYANRGSAGNLWTYLFLYSFLLDGWLHPLSLRSALRHARRGQLSARTAVFALIFVVPALTQNLAATERVLVGAFAPRPEGTEELSGVLLPTPVVLALREKAAFLASTPDSFYVTTNGYSMPLLVGHFPSSPMGDVFAESMTPADTRRLDAWIRSRKPARLLFDDPQGFLVSESPQQRYFDRLRASFADEYEVEGTAAGWLVLKRRTSVP